MAAPGRNPPKYPADARAKATPDSSSPVSSSPASPRKAETHGINPSFASTANQDPVELIASEFLDRVHKGENPTVDEYVAKYPALAEEIRDLFPAMLAMEQLKADKSGMNPRGVSGGLTLSRLGDFRIIREIGRGGMGIVYEAEQLSLKRRVAVKVLPKQALLNLKHAARFQREARTAANLHHANIVPVYGAGEQDGFHYIVMQLISGVGLDRILTRLSQTGAKADLTPAALGSLFGDAAVNRSARLRAVRSPRGKNRDEKPAGSYWQTVAWLGLQAARALEYAHELSILHRDIKPGNLLLDEQGTVVVADFGLAKHIEQADVSGTGEILGTLGYMAPEQLAGEADQRSDVYSLGLTLYEFLTLRSAFPSSNNSELIRQKTQTELPPPRKRNARIPRDLETIVLKAVAREPAHRYASAGALAEDLQRFLEDRAILARRVRPWEQFMRWCRRNPTVAMLSGISALLLVAVALVAGIGYARTNRALVRVSEEREKAEDQSRRAERTLEISLDALDKIYQRFAPDRLVEAAPLTVEGTGGVRVSIPSQSSLSPETAVLLEDILKFYDQFAEQNGGDARLQREAALANRRVGDIHARLGQLKQASLAYDRAIALYDQLRQSLGEDDYRLETARTRNALGKLQRMAGDESASRKSHLAALEILDSPAVANSPAAQRFELARTCFLLARRPSVGPETAPHDRGGRPERAAGPDHGGGPPPEHGPPPFDDGPPFPPPSGKGPPPFGKVPPEFDGPPEDGNRPHPHARHDEKSTHRPPSGPPPEVIREVTAYSDRAIELLTQLRREQPQKPEYRYLLALCYREHPPQDGFQGTEKAIALLEELQKEFPLVTDYRFELSQTLANIDVRDARRVVEKQADVLKQLDRGLKISEELTRENPQVPEYAAAQAELLLRIGTVNAHAATRADSAKRTAFLQEAEANFRKAVATQAVLVERYPAVLSQLVWLGRMQQQLARTLSELGQSVAARSQIEASIRSLEQSLEQHPQYDVLNMSLAENHQVLAEIQQKLGQNLAAKKARERAAQHRQQFKPPGR